MRAREKKDLIKARYKKRRRRVGKQRRHGVRMRRWYKKRRGNDALHLIVWNLVATYFTKRRHKKRYEMIRQIAVMRD